MYLLNGYQDMSVDREQPEGQDSFGAAGDYASLKVEGSPSTSSREQTPERAAYLERMNQLTDRYIAEGASMIAADPTETRKLYDTDDRHVFEDGKIEPEDTDISGHIYEAVGAERPTKFRKHRLFKAESMMPTRGKEFEATTATEHGYSLLEVRRREEASGPESVSIWMLGPKAKKPFIF